jgi:hypothetical protein
MIRWAGYPHRSLGEGESDSSARLSFEACGIGIAYFPGAASPIDLFLGGGMSSIMPARASKNLAVTVIGLITLLCGVGYLALGGDLIYGGASWFVHPDPAVGPILGTWLTLGASVLIVVGVLFLLLGAVVLLAAVGVLWRKQWGRILTFMVAVPAILLGLLCLSGVRDVVQDATVLAIAVTQILYGILALVVLSTERADFESLGEATGR